MPAHEFTWDEKKRAFDKTRGRCECCGKKLCWFNSNRYGGWGAWEAHHGGRKSPVILCTGGRENCHFRCGHKGDWNNRGITPKKYRY